MNITIHVTVCRKSRNQDGFWLVIGKKKIWFKKKSEAIKEVKCMAKEFALAIVPVARASASLCLDKLGAMMEKKTQ